MNKEEKLQIENMQLMTQNEFLMQRDNKAQVLEQEKENLIKHLEKEIKRCEDEFEDNLITQTYEEILERVKSGVHE